jgi:simple sugar transport system ATP-binding protein
MVCQQQSFGILPRQPAGTVPSAVEHVINRKGSRMSAPAPVLEARGISKSFGAVRALDDVNLQVFPGEIVALIGDNGAGKSTLINCLTGVFPPDAGEFIFEGQEVHLHSPQDARHLGIETVYQDLAVAPHLDSAANIYLGREALKPGILGKLGFLDNKFMTEETAGELKRLRVRIPDPRRRVFTLSGGQRQSVAVARSVKWASKIVIMDEPTAALGVAQSQMVLDLMREVRNAGIPVVFISHNMPHVFQVADRIVVLRLGTVVTELDPKTDSIDQAVSWMTGSTSATSLGGSKAA